MPTNWSEKLQSIWGRDLSGQRLTLAEALLSGGTEKRSTVVKPVGKSRTALKDREFAELDDSEVDYEFGSPNRFFGTHANLVPLVSAVQGQRPFYGARFFNQALPLVNPEAPLVQNLVDGDVDGRSFDDLMGETAGALRAKVGGRVLKVTPDAIELQDADGKSRTIDLYHQFAFNRKSAITNTPSVKVGDLVKPGHLLAKSNYTDEHGTLAMGTNVRVGLVPYLGHTMDDSLVISEALAKRMTSEQMVGHDLDYHRDVKGGKAHYSGIFPKRFVNDQLKKLDDDGVILPGQKVLPGDPLILATRPRVISSQAAQLGQLSKHMKNARSDAAVVWDHDDPGVVTDVAKVKGGVKVNVAFQSPTKVGDKLTLRTGQKGIVSHIIPDEHMPRTLDGKPLEMLLNPLGLPSRVNSSLPYELLLGKIARLTGKPYKLPGFNQPNEDWHDLVQAELDKHGLKDREEVFDPKHNRKLEQPIMVGEGYVQKLHHVSESKLSTRGQGSYDANMQPAHGGGETAQCFAPKQVIQTASGPMEIARLCEKKLRVSVLTWHAGRSEWVYRPVIDWFARKAKLCELRTVKFVTNCHRNSGSDSYFKSYNHSSLMVTLGHEVFTVRGKLQIAQLKVGDELLTWGPLATEDQLQLLIGSMLGDAHAHKSEDAVRIEHSMSQLDYVLWKQSILSGLGAYHFSTSRVASPSSVVTKITGKTAIAARSIHLGLPYVTKWARRFFYKEGRKTVTEAWLSKLNLFGFSVWFLDDGSTHFMPSRGKFGTVIATDSFNPVELGLLQQWLKVNTGVDFSVNGEGRLAAYKKQDALTIMDIVSTWVPWYVIPKTKVALRAYAKNKQKLTPVRMLSIENALGKVPVEVLSIEPYTHDKKDTDEVTVYDFTVKETHNYCAGGVSVSNSKRLSSLETSGLLSAGAYNVIRDGATVRGAKRDDYWSRVRQGHEAPEPGSPFVWSKFQALLNGAGYATRDLPDGEQRLQMWTDKDLNDHQPMEVQTGDIVDLGTLEPVAGGLFDPALTGANKWGSITLPFKVPNPAAHDMLRKLLGLTEKEFRSILAGQAELPDRLRGKLETPKDEKV